MSNEGQGMREEGGYFDKMREVAYNEVGGDSRVIGEATGGGLNITNSQKVAFLGLRVAQNG
jgi:hypothetical protein